MRQVVAALVVAASIVSPTAACTTARSHLATSVAREAEVRAAMNDFVDALNALDVPRLVARHASDVTGFVPSARAERVAGRAAVERIYTAYAARQRGDSSRRPTVPEDVTVAVSGDLAVVTFQVRGAPPLATRRRTFVFRREGDRWLIAHFHASDVVPPPG